MHATSPMGRSLDSLNESVLSLCHLGLGGCTQVVHFINKCLYPLNHPDGLEQSFSGVGKQMLVTSPGQWLLFLVAWQPPASGQKLVN